LYFIHLWVVVFSLALLPVFPRTKRVKP